MPHNFHPQSCATFFSFTHMSVDPSRAIEDYRDVAPSVLKLTRRGQPLAAKPNQVVWSEVLKPTFVCAGRVAALLALPVMIRFYISIEDGECTVERDLGETREVVRRNRTRDTDFINSAVLARRGVPKTRSEVVEPATGGLTETSRRWAKKWRWVDGALLGARAGATVTARKNSRPKEKDFIQEVLNRGAGSSRWRCA